VERSSRRRLNSCAEPYGIDELRIGKKFHALNGVHRPGISCWVDRAGSYSYCLGMKSVVSEKGQVTIPKKLRDRLGIRPGEVLDFVEENGRLVGTKSPLEDVVAAVSGILIDGFTTDDFLDEIRGEVLPGEVKPKKPQS
jgi:antitoxin PrlF